MQTTQTSHFAEPFEEEEAQMTVARHPNNVSAGRGRWWRRGVRRSARGQSLVEFAISLPFLIFLLLALVELGFLIRGHLTVTFATREGVRTATQAGDYTPVNTNLDFTPNDMRVPPGSDADTLLVSNMTSSLQEKLKDAYFLMTYRADSSDCGTYGLVPKSATNATDCERWGTVYFPTQDDDAMHTFSWPTPNPYQRVFEPVTRTLVLTVTNPVGGQKYVVPYIREGWLPGVMDNGTFTYTVSIPISLPVNQTGNIQVQTDPDGWTGATNYTVRLPGWDAGLTPSVDITNSNLVQVRRSTHPCPAVDPVQQTNKYYGATKTIVTAPAHCGTNNPNLHITPATRGAEYVNAKLTNALDPIIAKWKASFVADPWYPAWRWPGGVCDIQKPSTTSGTGQYYNNTRFSPDWLGVRVDYRHYWVTSWFGVPTLNLTDKSVKILEPVPRPSPDWKCGQ